MKYKQRGGRPTGLKKETPKQMRQMRRAARKRRKMIEDRPISERGRKKGRRDYQAGGSLSEAKKKDPKSFIEDSKEVKFGKVPGAIKRSAKKLAKSKANMKKGMKMLGESNTKKETKRAARTMKKGVRQKKASARIRDNYEFRKSGKRGPTLDWMQEGGEPKKALLGMALGAAALKGGKERRMARRAARQEAKAQGKGLLGRMAAGAAAGAGVRARQMKQGIGNLKAGLQNMKQNFQQGMQGQGAAPAMAAQQQSMAAQADPMAGADPAAEEADPMTEEMQKGGLVDRRQRGGCRKGQPCEAYDGGRGPKGPKKKRRRKSTGFKTRVRGRIKYQSGGSCGPGGCDQGGGGQNRKNKKYERAAKRAARRRARNRGKGRGRPKV